MNLDSLKTMWRALTVLGWMPEIYLVWMVGCLGWRFPRSCLKICWFITDKNNYTYFWMYLYYEIGRAAHDIVLVLLYLIGRVVLTLFLIGTYYFLITLQHDFMVNFPSFIFTFLYFQLMRSQLNFSASWMPWAFS